MTNDRVSAHFTEREVLRDSGYDAIPAMLLPNVKMAAASMEEARAVLGGKAVIVRSWLRTPEVNASVGGAVNSGHPQGLALDFDVEGMSPSQVMAALAPHVAALGIDQLIEYTTHVHVSFDPRRRAQLLLAERVGRDTTYTRWTGTPTRPSLAVASAGEPGTPKKGTLLWYLAIAAGAIEVLRHILGSVRN